MRRGRRTVFGSEMRVCVCACVCVCVCVHKRLREGGERSWGTGIGTRWGEEEGKPVLTFDR